MILSIKEGTKVLLPVSTKSPTIIYRPYKSPERKENEINTPISTIKENIMTFDDENNKNVVIVQSIPFSKTVTVISSQK